MRRHGCGGWNERVQFREEELEVLRVSRRQAAAMMLYQRGCPQTPATLGMDALLDNLSETISVVHQQLAAQKRQYIAPPECEVHRYNVKRPSRSELRQQNIPEELIPQYQHEYWYNKLTSEQQVFQPSQRGHFNTRRNEWEETASVRSLHLGRDGDPRAQEGQAGIERRNALLKLRTAMQNSETLLREAVLTYQQECPEPLPIPVLDIYSEEL